KGNLVRRREIINSILKNQKNSKKIVTELKKIKKYENKILWFFSDLGKEFKDFYFKKDYFNSQDLLSTSNLLKIYMLSLTILIYLLIFIVLKYYGIDINVKDYFKNIYTGYQMFIVGIVSLFISNLNIISLVSNMLTTFYVLYQMYTVYSSFDSSISHYNKCGD